MTTTTFRAAYWTDGQSDVLLAVDGPQYLEDELLMADARAEAEKIGLVMGEGRIIIGEYTA